MSEAIVPVLQAPPFVSVSKEFDLLPLLPLLLLHSHHPVLLVSDLESTVGEMARREREIDQRFLLSRRVDHLHHHRRFASICLCPSSMSFSLELELSI